MNLFLSNSSEIFENLKNFCYFLGKLLTSFGMRVNFVVVIVIKWLKMKMALSVVGCQQRGKIVLVKRKIVQGAVASFG